INHGWDVLNKYYGLTDACPAYIIAVALDPTMKMAWFNSHWADKPDEVQRAQDIVDDLWRTSY
ncbi:hypothetical protein FN846DRAFT_766029, partial [Sphaerosporella brunnea]